MIMKVSYSKHAIIRMKQRGITKLEVKFILKHHDLMRLSKSNTKIASGHLAGRRINVVFSEKESYINIVTVL